MTSVGAGGEKLGMAVNSFNSVSLDPPLVLFSIAQNAYSVQAFIDSGRFCGELAIVLPRRPIQTLLNGVG
ncbi:MAG: flavin reductase family protein [Candidatus Porifericomitaceae bacterium WSBS_2022_MAG_OTU9]